MTKGSLKDLFAAVRAATRMPADWDAMAQTVASQVRPHLPGVPEVLACVPGDAHLGDEHSQVLHVEPDGTFSVVALIARPGQATSVHDHTTWCVVAVISGLEREERFRIDGTGEHLEPAGVRMDVTGTVTGFAPPGDIHRVSNAGTTAGISLHIYGTDIRRIGNSVRRTYDLPILGQTTTGDTVAHTNGEVTFTATVTTERNSGWTCVVVPGSGDIFGTRKAVKVAGTVDGHPFQATLLPMGDGTHMVPLRAALRKVIGKAQGEQVTVHLAQRFT